jgi:large subunit ribosomal protein L18
MKSQEKQSRQSARARRTHALARVSGRPRLIVVKSNRAIAAHLMDDEQGKIVCGVSSLKLKTTGIVAAAEVGKAIAEKAKKLKISEVAFDRNGRQYHGQVKALADAARNAGLEF